ncbi:MAG: AAA family ATPase, partial [Coleofasciculus sp. S288]|nr:AAA family ATPase [Coleofasciculus sp. S288]
VMEDFGGIALSNYITSSEGKTCPFLIPDALSEFLNIAIQIAETLKGLYSYRIIHKDIKPHNILINPETKQIKLIDFSISSLLPRENQEIQNPNLLEGTLAYMSPEQTGRMNRGIDYRSDFYSLGVTFYELLTGQLPFQSNDAMELVHCHIAKIPTPPIEVNPSIPQSLNDIVLKLMAKTAEERYQSAVGIKHDLEQCWEYYSTQGSITTFKLGIRDIPDRFVIPEKLYGREAEVATLLAAFERVAGREDGGTRGRGDAETRRHRDAEIEENTQSKIVRLSAHAEVQNPKSKIELMLVAGFSGIGKTAVVNEVHKPIVRQRGYFIKGKFDQFKRDIPFSAWVQALQNLIRQLLTETADEVQKWKAKLLKALGENGQVIINVIPELEFLIDKQPPVPELEGSAAQNRFNLLFQKFIRVFAIKEHPLVIFLDDLQWADSASLKLMQLLLSETETRYLLLIGAYRDNEVSPAHPLMLTLDEIRKAKDDKQDACPIVNQITLAPLDQPSLNRLIADTLSCPPEQAVPLTELVLAKTKGNPFFSNQFLKSLYEDGLISFDFSQSSLSKGRWQYDIAQVRALTVSDDVVEFLALQLQKLSITTQAVMKLAACIGNQFDLATLAIVHEKSQAETAADLWRALQEGLVIPISEGYKFFQSDANESTRYPDATQTVIEKEPESPQSPITNYQSPITNHQLPIYKFLHDRVQQAAYFLIPEDQKQLTHLQIGRLLLSNTPEEERDEKIFDIVNQLNIGVELITHQTEREELAKLNLIAGRKAKTSTAYAAAVQYLTVGMKLLAADSWQTQYELTLALHEETTEAAFLSGDLEQMEELADSVLQQAKTLLDKVKVYEVKIQARISQSKPLLAVNTALAVLKLFGMEFPEQPSPLDIQRRLEETASNLAGKRIEDLIELPMMKEPEKLAVMRILSSVASASYRAAPELLVLIAFKQVNLSIKYGNVPLSAFAYATYGMILCGVVLDIESGYQFGELALSVLSRFHSQELKAKTFLVVGFLIGHWKEHIRNTLTLFQAGYQSGLESGDLEYSSYCASFYCKHSYFMGKDLTVLEKDMKNYGNSIEQLRQTTTIYYHKIFQQTVSNLIGHADDTIRLIGDFYNEEQFLPLHLEENDRNAVNFLFLNKLILCYLFGHFPQAVENAVEAEKYLDSITGMYAVPLFHFYDSLAQLAVYAESSPSEQKSIVEKVVANQEKMKTWADCAPMNHLHKFYLVEAERYRVLESYVEAMDYYDKAIALAKEHEYINEEALANELAAKFYLSWGKEKIASVYLTDAYYAYARWGAEAKVEDLEQRYPQLLAPILNQKMSRQTSGTVGSLSVEGSAILDLATVLKASQALSGEIQLDKLLSRLMQVALENAGAEKCILILSKAGKLAIEATQVNGMAEATVLQSIPVEQSQELPVTLINYVDRTSETIVLDDARTETTFAADSYIIQHQLKSVLCTPLLNQGKLIGILYLENNLISGAFTSDRLEVLNVLSSQAAISIANAQLYTEVRESERRLAQYLEAMPVGVSVHTPTGEIYYANQAARQLLGMNVLQDANAEQLSQAYQVYRAGTNQLYPTDQLPIVRSLSGQRAKADDLELHQPDKIIPLDVSTTPIFDETGNLVYAIATFQDISDRKQSEKLLTEYNRTLELQVTERTQELKNTLNHLKATQDELIQSEKMAALGQLVAGVAHEINTPLGAIRSSVTNIAEFLSENLEQLPKFFQTLSKERQRDFFTLMQKSIQQPISLSTKEKRQIKKDLKAQLESHSIANADSLASTLVTIRVYDGIEPFLPLFNAPDSETILKTAYQFATLQRSTRTITTAIDRAAKVVFALKSYARYDQSGEKVQAQVVEGIETVLILYHNQLKQGVDVIKNYEKSLPSIQCYPDELNQVWTNLIHNALQAMNNQGTLTIDVRQQNGNLLVSIRDSGQGIPPEIMPRIFEPFFTTKPAGEGSGLGLDIVKKILEKHEGKISVESEPGQTTFTVSLPIHPTNTIEIV